MKCTFSGCDRCTVEATTRRRPQPAPAAPPKRWWVEFTDYEGDTYAANSWHATLSEAHAVAVRAATLSDTAKPRVYFAAKPRPPRQGPR